MAEYTPNYISANTYVITKSEGENSTDLVLYTGPNKDGSLNINLISIGGNRITKKKWGILEREELTVSEVFTEVNRFAPDIDPEVKRSVGDHLGRNLRVRTERVETEFGVALGTDEGGTSARVTRTTEVK